MQRMNTADDDFYTISRNPNDVRSILEEEYNTKRRVSEKFGTGEIFELISDSISKKPFVEYLFDTLKSAGRAAADKNDRNECVKFFLDAFSKSGIIGAEDIFEDEQRVITRELVRKNSLNWVKGMMPSRKYIFLIAAALRLECSELSELLTIASGDRDINFKDPTEVIICHILGQHRDYSYALSLSVRARQAAKAKAAAGEVPAAGEHINSVLTIRYKERYTGIRTEEQLMEFLTALTAQMDSTANSTSAVLCMNDLLEKLHRISALDKKLMAKTESDIDISLNRKINYGAIERYLYYFLPVKNLNGHYTTNPFARYENGNISGKSMNRLGEVRWFFSTLLRRQDIKKMHMGKKPITRDTIITLAFFVICDSDPFGSIYEHISDINDCLSFCRFEQINFSYSYDFFIFMCMQTSDPLMVFRRVWKMSWK